MLTVSKHNKAIDQKDAKVEVDLEVIGGAKNDDNDKTSEFDRAGTAQARRRLVKIALSRPDYDTLGAATLIRLGGCKDLHQFKNKFLRYSTEHANLQWAKLEENRVFWRAEQSVVDKYSRKIDQLKEIWLLRQHITDLKWQLSQLPILEQRLVKQEDEYRTRYGDQDLDLENQRPQQQEEEQEGSSLGFNTIDLLAGVGALAFALGTRHLTGSLGPKFAYYGGQPRSRKLSHQQH